MLKNFKTKNKLQKGFTIIEVMIVLAIAGLILVVVLIAIPQLQRNQRNQARQSVASRIVTEINNFAGNNNGDLPEAVTPATDSKQIGSIGDDPIFWDRYLGCDTSAPPECTANINDPRTGEPVGTGADGGVNLEQVIPLTDVAVELEPGDETNIAAGSFGYNEGYVCDGEDIIAASNRNFVFMMKLEGGALYCLDNR